MPPVSAAARSTLLAAGTAVALLFLAMPAVRYWTLGAYLDHIEGTVLVNGWRFFQGAALYERQDGAPRFSTFYGPLAYLIEVPLPFLLGKSIAATKVTSAVAVVAAIGVLTWHGGRRQGAGLALSLSFFLAAGLLLFCPVTFWVRPDPLELLLVALAVVSLRSEHRAIWVGLCLGCAVNLKVHAFLYFLPILVDVIKVGRGRALAIGAVTTAVTFFAPFCLPGISLPDYVVSIGSQIGNRGESLSTLPALLLPLFALHLPIAVDVATAGAVSLKSHRLFLLAIAVTSLLLLYPANFPGAGAYHFLPFLPVLWEARGRLASPSLLAGLSPVLAVVLGIQAAPATSKRLDYIATLAPMAQDALSYAQQQPDRTVQVGYGKARYQVSQLSRALLSINGHPALIDAQVLMELQYIGVDGSRRWIRYLTGCEVDDWLIPAGDVPFGVASIYDQKPLFSEAFRAAFAQHYRPVGRTAHFDVWRCTP